MNLSIKIHQVVPTKFFLPGSVAELALAPWQKTTKIGTLCNKTSSKIEVHCVFFQLEKRIGGVVLMVVWKLRIGLLVALPKGCRQVVQTIGINRNLAQLRSDVFVDHSDLRMSHIRFCYWGLESWNC